MSAEQSGGYKILSHEDGRLEIRFRNALVAEATRSVMLMSGEFTPVQLGLFSSDKLMIEPRNTAHKRTLDLVRERSVIEHKGDIDMVLKGVTPEAFDKWYKRGQQLTDAMRNYAADINVVTNLPTLRYSISDECVMPTFITGVRLGMNSEGKVAIEDTDQERLAGALTKAGVSAFDLSKSPLFMVSIVPGMENLRTLEGVLGIGSHAQAIDDLSTIAPQSQEFQARLNPPGGAPRGPNVQQR
jgi:hypothetical protein